MNNFRTLITFVSLIGMAAPVNAETSVTRTYTDAGITACKEKTRQVTNYLVDGNKESSHVFWNKNNKNNRNVNALIMKNYSDGDSHIHVTMNPEGTACDWSYVETFFVPQRCIAAKETLMSDAKYDDSMGNTSVYTKGALTFYLTELQQGCLISKREAAYD